MSAVANGLICGLDAQAQVELVRRREVPPTALVEAAIARIEQLDPRLNAVTYRAFEQALVRAGQKDLAGPMARVPCLLKASMEYPGFPHVSGSRTCVARVGRQRFPFAARLDEAGLVPCGMSAMPEFGLIGTSEGLLYGPTRNPWRLSRGSGGSTSGAAVAVSTGMVPLATGSDGGGSIRIPASHCGVIGFKPSRGWNLRARAANLVDDLLASDALLARSMRDISWAARYLRSQPAREIDAARSLRVAVCLEGLDGRQPNADVVEVVDRTAVLCEHVGYRVEAASLPLDLVTLGWAFGVIWSYGAGEVVDLCRAGAGAKADDELEPWTLGLAQRREGFSLDEVADAFHAIARIDRNLDAFWSRYDVVLGPVASSTAPPLGLLAPDRPFDALWQDHFRHVNYTQLQNMAGYPGLSLPLFTDGDGMPAGSMFWTRQGADDLLLALGAELEDAHPLVKYTGPLPDAEQPTDTTEIRR